MQVIGDSGAGGDRVSIRWRLCREDRRSTSALATDGAGLKTTRYFEEQVLRKRPYLRREWCSDVIEAPLRREVQEDGRLRFWGRIAVPDQARPRFLRVITLADGETIHNAFFDRNFREGDQ